MTDTTGRAEDTVLHKLQERVKELTALHRTARLLVDHSRPWEEVLQQIVQPLPQAWQYPEITSARITFRNVSFVSHPFAASPWRQATEFRTPKGHSGSLEVYYAEERPESQEGPFLKEERALIDSLGEMIRLYLERKETQAALLRMNEALESRVRQRTAELTELNISLQQEIRERKNSEERIRAYQQRLRRLASQLSIAEARERRAIAVDLHDHIGQSLAMIKIRLSALQGDAVFSGHDNQIREIRKLLDQTIRNVRDLTFEVSPPVLYELGLIPALDWLAEDFRNKLALPVFVVGSDPFPTLPQDVQILLFKAVRELIMNAAKHAAPGQVNIRATCSGDSARIEVADDGRGFAPRTGETGPSADSGFGLFSIRERLDHIGGRLQIHSLPGSGSTVSLEVPL